MFVEENIPTPDRLSFLNSILSDIVAPREHICDFSNGIAAIISSAERIVRPNSDITKVVAVDQENVKLEAVLTD